MVWLSVQSQRKGRASLGGHRTENNHNAVRSDTNGLGHREAATVNVREREPGTVGHGSVP